MRLLFVHHGFPAQFCHLAPFLASRRENEVLAVGDRTKINLSSRSVPGVKLFGYDFPSEDGQPGSGAEFELRRILHRGIAVAGGARHLVRSGFQPDLIIAHPGWGDALFLKDIFPRAKLLLYCETYFRTHGAEIGFDPEFPEGPDATIYGRIVSAAWPMTLESADYGIAPTKWQRGLFPAWFGRRISVIHDGIDTDTFVPKAGATFHMRDGRSFSEGEEIVTFIARSLEPHRGFHIFMRAIPEIQRRRPKAHVVVVGGDGVSYSAPLPNGETYRERMLRELDGSLDLNRLHFCGSLPQPEVLSLLQLSAVHVYLVYPIGISWSALEAMSVGCVVVASRTGPMEEIIEDGRNGWLVNFFSPVEISERVDAALRDAKRSRLIRKAARRTLIQRFDLKRVCLPAQAKLLQRLVRQ